jgi:hypothetical protein
MRIKGWRKINSKLWRANRENAIGLERFSSKYVDGKGFEYKNYSVILYNKYYGEKMLVNPNKTKKQALKYAYSYMRRHPNG